MTTLEELLCKRIGPKETTIALPSLKDPDTGEPAQLRFRVPTCVEVANVMAPCRTDVERSAAIVASCLVEPSLTSTTLQSICEDSPGAYVEPKMVAARIFTMYELEFLSSRLFEIGKILEPLEEVEKTAKN